MSRLTGKIAIVTGGAPGQGAGISRAFVVEGAKVMIADIAKDEGQALADDFGPKGVRVNSVHPGVIDTPKTRVHGVTATHAFGG